MAWTDITAPVVGDATKKVSFADAVIGNLVYLKANMGGSGSGGGSLITNGNFELDGDSDGIPDGWDLTEYTAGAFAINSTTPGEGAKGIKFTSPGATGGGDVQSTDFIPICSNKAYGVDFVTWASAAGLHNLVQVRWYSTALESNYISTTTLYDSVANPTSKTRFIEMCIPPSGAMFAKLKLVGALNNIAVVGIANFDDVKMSSGIVVQSPIDIGADALDTIGWETVGNPIFLYLEPGSPGELKYRICAQLYAWEGWTFSWRIKIGTVYSNEVTIAYVGPGNTTQNVDDILNINVAALIGTRVSVEFQANIAGTGSGAHGFARVFPIHFAAQ